MLKYAPLAFRPAVTSPTFRRQAQTLGQTFDGLFGWSSATGDGIRLAFHGATAALGYRVWLREKGFWKYFGLFLALGQTVGAICDFVSLMQRATGIHPPEK